MTDLTLNPLFQFIIYLQDRRKNKKLMTAEELQAYEKMQEEYKKMMEAKGFTFKTQSV
jgi:hypothetical protein